MTAAEDREALPVARDVSPEKPLVPPLVPGIAVAATGALAVLRLTGVTAWPWWVVLAPSWGLVAALLAVAYATVAADFFYGGRQPPSPQNPDTERNTH